MLIAQFMLGVCELWVVVLATINQQERNLFRNAFMHQTSELNVARFGRQNYQKERSALRVGLFDASPHALLVKPCNGGFQLGHANTSMRLILRIATLLALASAETTCSGVSVFK